MTDRRTGPGDAMRAPRRLALVLCLLALAPLPALAAEAAGPPALGAPGTRLPAAPAGGDVRVVVQAPAQPVLSTHVILREHGTNRLLHRTADGFFIPWDRDPARLADTGARPQGGQLTFKVLDESLAGASLPLTVVVLARTAAGDLTGEFMVERR